MSDYVGLNVIRKEILIGRTMLAEVLVNNECSLRWKQDRHNFWKGIESLLNHARALYWTGMPAC